ncbi:MAG: DUF4147 domain-containing protein, partial [Methylococcales bacterium]|nr:DUF4147 domain-containing protein [Methylococcales bacterium]
LLTGLGQDDRVLFLISGGSSALLSMPRIQLDCWIALNRALLLSGADIGKVNSVRRVFDSVKGGGLVRMASPAVCTSLILSDVPGNDVRVIGSGLTVADDAENSSIEDIEDVLNTFGVYSRMDSGSIVLIKRFLQSLESNLGVVKTEMKCDNRVIGDVGLGVEAAYAYLVDLGYKARVVTVRMVGEARDLGRDISQSALQLSPGSCLIYGGEPTVTIGASAYGYGGRNQELALAAALELEGHDDILVMAFSTDADDGFHPQGRAAVAGAYVSGQTVVDAQELGLDMQLFLEKHDSYTFFDALGWGHLIGKQESNVNDIVIALRLKK